VEKPITVPGMDRLIVEPISAEGYMPPPELVDDMDSDDEDDDDPIDYVSAPGSILGTEAEPSNLAYYAQISMKKATALDKEMTAAGIRKEMLQMHTKKVFKPVDYSKLTVEEKKNIIPSNMWMKPKSGEGEKVLEIRGRFVAGGHKQDRALYEDHSSATIRTESLMMMLAEAAGRRFAVRSMDIEGAYLQADMVDTVHMSIRPELAQVLCDIDPIYKKFLVNGTLYVKLLKALYGCIQSGKLWYSLLKKVLLSLGYIMNLEDECVFRKTFEDNGDVIIITVGFHVDDLLNSGNDDKRVVDSIKEIGAAFSGYKMSEPSGFKHLGMRISRTEEDDVIVDMVEYTENLIKEYCTDFGYTSLDEAKYPHTNKLFEEDNTDAVSEDLRSKYHTTVCRILFMSKKCRADVLLDVSHHTSRVTCATVKNLAELKMLVSYLQTELYRGVVFKGGGNMLPDAHGDSAFMVHEDCRSRGGSFITMCGGVVGTHAGKQTILAKSSTEAELVELDTTSGKAVETRRFLMGFGDEIGPIPSYQDNQSAIAIVKIQENKAHCYAIF
jgi:hypothetical protein